jgi:hypothetical protein
LDQIAGGVILRPVVTGKAQGGLLEQIRKGSQLRKAAEPTKQKPTPDLFKQQMAKIRKAVQGDTTSKLEESTTYEEEEEKWR